MESKTRYAIPIHVTDATTTHAAINGETTIQSSRSLGKAGVVIHKYIEIKKRRHFLGVCEILR